SRPPGSTQSRSLREVDSLVARKGSPTRECVMSTVLIDTTDLGEAEEILSANYTRMRFGAAAGVTTHTRVLRSQVGSLMIDDLKYSYDMRFDVEPMADIVLCRVHSGTIEQRFPDGQ